MPSPVRKGMDLSAGHGYTPQLPIEGSPDVFINGAAVVRLGDKYANHSFPGVAPLHNLPAALVPPLAAAASTTVFANNIGVHRIGDAISCGDIAAAGSDTVFIGG